MGEQVAARLKWGCSSVGRAPALQAGVKGSNPSISIACLVHADSMRTSEAQLPSVMALHANAFEFIIAQECKHSTRF